MTQAMVVDSHGSSPVWKTHQLPDLGPNDLSIEIRACALNFADLLMIEGKYQDSPPLPFVPGMEISGRIDEVGTSVTAFQKGQRITSYCGHGGMAEKTVVSADRCMVVPDTMDDATAAAFPIAYGTSHLGLTRRAALSAGETLVVLGAAGGVGLTAVEVGKALGARVIAVARGPKKQAVAKRAGADEILEADPDTLRDDLKSLGPINVVYDPVGGALGEAALRTLAPEGRYLVIGFASGDLPNVRPNHLLVKNVSVIGFYWGGYQAFAPGVLKESLAELIQWQGEKRIRPHVSHQLPMDNAEEALNLLRTRTATGKVVLTL